MDSYSQTSDSSYLKAGDDHAQATAEGGRALLDLRTQLVKPSAPSLRRVGWKFSIWPACSEANLVLITSGSRGRSKGVSRETSEDVVAENWRIANGRAASRSRRYFVSNKLRYMWVLTFRESQQDRRTVMRLVSDLARRLRALNGGKNFPYWYSPELHPGGHGWHVNLFIPLRIPHAVVANLWGHGFVWVTDFATSQRGPHGEPLGLCRTGREALRRAAQYGCKYSQKDWSPEHVGMSNHRYEIAQGFAPLTECQWFRDPLDAEAIVADLVPLDDRTRLRTWDSNQDPDWTRVPVRTWRW